MTNHLHKWLPILILLPLLTAIPFIRYNYPAFLPATSSRALINFLELLFSLHIFLFVASSGLPVIRRGPRLLIGAWLMATMLATLQAVHFFPALVRQAEWFVHLLFGIALWHYLRNVAKARNTLFLLIPAGFLVAGLLVLLEWHIVLPNPVEAGWMTGIPGFRHIRHFAYYLIISLIFGTYFLVGQRVSRAATILSFLFLSFCWGFLFWSGSRGAILAVLGAAPLIFWLFPGQIRKKLLVWLAASAVLGLLLSLFYRVSDPGLGLFRMSTMVQESVTLDQISSGRLAIWSRTLQAAADSLWLGLGPDGYAYLQPSPLRGTIQPHNMWLQLLVEWGAIGAVLTALLLGLGLFHLFRKIRAEQDSELGNGRILALWGILANLILGLTDGTFYHPFPLLFIAICFAVGLQPQAGERLRDFKRGDNLLWTGAASLLLVIVLLHGTNRLSLHAGIRNPNSLQATLLKSFPSSVEGLENRTIPRWRHKYPAEALAWTRWAQLHARDRLPFLLLEMDLLLAEGQKQEAANRLAAALAIAPKNQHERLKKTYAPWAEELF
jgi:O-antigen ligase